MTLLTLGTTPLLDMSHPDTAPPGSTLRINLKLYKHRILTGIKQFTQGKLNYLDTPSASIPVCLHTLFIARTLDIVANLPPVMMVATFVSAFFGAVFAPVLGFAFNTINDIMSQFDVELPRIVRKDDKYLHYQGKQIYIFDILVTVLLLDRQSRMDGPDSDASLWEDAVDNIVESLER